MVLKLLIFGFLLLSTPKSQTYTINTVEVESIVYSENSMEDPILVKTLIEDDSKIVLSDDDIYLIALLTVTEAEGECEEGQRLVIDTVLNRLDSDYFPDTITEVIYQKNQFSGMSTRLDVVLNNESSMRYVTTEITELVKQELESRTNNEVMFFCAGDYSKYGDPLFTIGGHYFSKY